MSIKKTVAALLILAAVAAVYFFYERPRITREAEEKKQEGYAFDLAWDDLSKIDIDAAGLQTVMANVEGGEGWKVIKPYQDDADKFAVQGIISKFRTTKPDRIIDDPDEDLSIYGLPDSTFRITFTAAAHSQTLIFGASHKIGDAVYAMIDGLPKLFVFPSSLKNSLLEPSDKYRDKEILPTTYDREPIKVSYSRGGKPIYILGKERIESEGDDDSASDFPDEKSEWKLTGPVKWWRADGEAVDKVMQGLRSLKVKSIFKENAENLEEYGLGEDQSVFTVQYGDGKTPESIEISIGSKDPAGDYYAVPPKGYLCSIPGHAMEKIDLQTNDLKDKTLVDFNVPDVHNWVLRFGDKTINISRSSDGDLISEAAGALDQEKVLDALRRLVDVEGRRFLSSPQLETAQSALADFDARFEMYGADKTLLAWIEAARMKSDGGSEIVAGRGNLSDGIFEMDPGLLKDWPDSIDEWLTPIKEETAPDADVESDGTL